MVPNFNTCRAAAIFVKRYRPCYPALRARAGGGLRPRPAWVCLAPAPRRRRYDTTRDGGGTRGSCPSVPRAHRPDDVESGKEVARVDVAVVAEARGPGLRRLELRPYRCILDVEHRDERGDLHRVRLVGDVDEPDARVIGGGDELVLADVEVVDVEAEEALEPAEVQIAGLVVSSGWPRCA